MPANTNENNPTFSHLCAEIKSQLSDLPKPDVWYLIIATALVSCHKPDRLGELWHIITTDAPSQSKAQVSLKIRDALLKSLVLIGIPGVIIAIQSLAEAQGDVEGEKARSELSPQLASLAHDTCVPRGRARLEALYQANLEPIVRSFGAHCADMEWAIFGVVYGMFLSDLAVLDSQEAQAVAMTSILCSGYRAPGVWHLRASRRVGWTEEQVGRLRDAIGGVAKWCGVERAVVEGWPKMEDVGPL